MATYDPNAPYGYSAKGTPLRADGSPVNFAGDKAAYDRYLSYEDELSKSSLAWNTGPTGRIETYRNTGVDIGRNPNAAAIMAGQTSPGYTPDSYGQASGIGSLASLLEQLAGSKNSYLGWDEAQQRAGSELNPLYDAASTKLSQSLNADMERRGIYNAPLASGIMTEKQGALSNEQVAAISERANQLIQNDQTLTLQEKQMQMDTLNNLLSSLIGREANLADVALREGELTGVYQGQQTLSGKAFDLQSATQSLNNALSTVESLGKVTTQEQADLLGVPIGTPSWQAKNAVDARRQELEMFNREMSFKQSSQALQNQAKAAEDLMANFNKDMAIWEATGVAPNTQALQSYGITPGTPWSVDIAQRKLAEAQAKIDLIGAEEELQFQSRATNFMSMYGVTRGIAEVALILIDQANTLAEAKSLANAQRSVLTQEGINMTTLDSALTKYYGQQTTFGGSSTSQTQRGGQWTLNGQPFDWSEWFNENFGRTGWSE